MRHYSLAVRIPETAPFDRPDSSPGNWYDSFLGNIVLPVFQTGCLSRFWFSHYGGFGNNPHAKFRFSTDDFECVNSVVTSKVEEFSLQYIEEHGKTYPSEFDIIGDLVPAHDKAHYGDNKRHQSHHERGELLYSFLSSAAELTLHCLSYSDDEGHWHRENNPDNGNTQYGDTTETIHHLFCNLSDVPTSVCLVPVAGQVGPPFQLMSPLYAKITKKFAASTQVVPVKY